MIRLVRTIVDDTRLLVGFLVEGRGTDLEGFTSEIIQKPIPLSALAAREFENRQVRITRRGIKEKGRFKINELPMLKLEDNEFEEVSNKISLRKRYVQGNELIGFEVGFGDGSIDNFKYKHVIKLSSWYNSDNFVVRTSSTGNKFISGKAGVLRLEELPEIRLGDKPDNKKKAKAKLSKDNTKVEMENTVDIIDIYTALNKAEGLVINLPDEQYERTSTSGQMVAQEFTQLGIGEYAYPYLGYNRKRLNANASFRKPGTVPVDFGTGIETPIQTFTYSTKNIFYDGENHIKRFGVAIPKDYESTFIDYFGRSMSITPIENDKMIQAITSLTGKGNMVFYEVDARKIDLMTKENARKYYMSPKELREIVEKAFIPAALNKYLSPRYGLIGRIEKEHGISLETEGAKEPIGLYAGMNDEFRQRIQDAGINIYTGSFDKREAYDGERKTTGKKEKQANLEISYIIKGYDITRWTGKQIAASAIKGEKLPKQLIDIIQDLESIKNPREQLGKANALLSKTKESDNYYNKKIWLHKCAMYVLGENGLVHTLDNKSWQQDTKSRAKANIYDCIEPGCAGLRVAILNSRIPE